MCSRVLFCWWCMNWPSTLDASTVSTDIFHIVYPWKGCVQPDAGAVLAVMAQQNAAARPCASICTSPPCRWLNFFLQLQKKAERAAQLHYRCQGLSNEPSDSSLGAVLTPQHAAARGAADASRFANTSRGVSIPILFIHNSNSVLCSYAELRTSNLCLW